MTGYGSAERAVGGRRIRVEVRSVNQRFLDVQIKAPRLLLQIEDRIKKAIESAMARGRVSVYAEWHDSDAASCAAVNLTAARGLVESLRRLQNELSLPGDISVGLVASQPQILEVIEEVPSADDIWRDFAPALDAALADVVAMREREGAELARDFTARFDAVDGLVKTLEKAAPRAAAVEKARLAERVKSLMGEGLTVDEARLAQELAMAAERADYTEEVVRLKSHVTQSRHCLASGVPVGKRLNFLVQEMHREVNTVGSKNSDATVSAAVIALKEEVEKLREQVQNVE
jgi:uncharacterized protein (TIGR00255 family)